MKEQFMINTDVLLSMQFVIDLYQDVVIAYALHGFDAENVA